ncbi:uncharacterized protein HMF8227_02288 [Saliniradius amylolyticus]|uniref:Peptidase S54 rhomboid domain-containing protein n=1 Tax=Saliniradius amylolyticus TaxID=2183582 RepID=A0A2S2E507_9ALTE|nr:rhomboid family intramembrane serine protease [Saliniradius amylolyticus]AWL12741.1 uncharacterized protein HMF8227_02288 [Saliniradius amylolyticus]
MLKTQIQYLVWFCALLLILEVLNTLTGRQWLTLGLVPRNSDHLWGIVFSPFLHHSWSHLTSNLLILIPLLWLTLLLHWQRAVGLVLLWLILMPGVLVWLFGRDGLHVGASGLVYGLLGFLLYSGFTSGKFWRFAIAIGLLLLHAGLFWGLLPGGHYLMSWEYHLSGFICGLLAGRMMPGTSHQRQYSGKI